MLSNRAVRAAHYASAYNSAAMNAFISAVSVDMFPGRCLEAAVAIRRRAAIHTLFFIGVMLMKAVQALGTAGTEFGGTAMYTFGHKKPLVND